MESTIALLTLTIVILLMVLQSFRIRRKAKDKVSRERKVGSLTLSERYSEYPTTNVIRDINRCGRWKVTHLDKSVTTRIGNLSEALGDSLRSFSPAVSYREIQ